MSNDLERPLGLDRRNKAAPAPPRRGLFLPALTLGVAAVAGWFAFDRMPEPAPVEKVAVEAPVAAKPEDAKPALSPEAQAKLDEKALQETASSEVSPPLPAGGAKIIHVNPDADTQGIIKVRDPSKLAQELAVAHIPDPDLIEKAATGVLPRKAADGRRPFDVYQRPWSGTRGARVAIVIGGMGVSQTSTQAAIEKLPPEVTLAFAPQGNSLSRWAQTARRKGHEILLQLPMEPFDYPRVNPGRGTLLADAAAEANLSVMRDSMGRLTNYTGVVNYLGARFTAEAGALDPVMRELSDRGLMYLDDGTSARSQADSIAASDRVPFAAGDLVIDQVQDKNEILKSLDQLEATARARGTAIATGTGFDVTVDAVAEWVKGARKRGIEVVGVASLARDPEQ